MEKARILIVEDEAIIAMELESQLQGLGYEVTSIVDTGEKAIEKAESDKPDLILMDIRIKGEIDGIEAAEEIRNRFGIPVIFSTAYLDEERIERAKITMPFGYVLKPIQERDLKVTIEMALYVSKVDKERGQAEEALRKSEEKANTLLNASTNTALLIEPDGTIVAINDLAAKAFGGEEKEIIGKNLWELASNMDPEVVEKRKAITQELFENGKPKRFEDSRGKIHFDNSLYPIIDESGKIIQCALFAQNITERKQAEDEIIRAKILLESSIESPKDMIILSLDREYRYLFFNTTHAESMVQVYGAQPQIGDCIFDHIKGQDDIEKLKAHYDRAMGGEGHSAIEEYGEGDLCFYYEMHFNPIFDDKKDIIGVTAFAMNVTERKQMEEKSLKNGEFLQTIIDATWHPFYVIDAKTRIVKHANKSTGINSIGKTCHLATHNSPVPCNTKEHPCPLDIILKTKQPTVVEHVHIQPDGTEKRFEIHATPLFDDNGEVEYIVESNIDISERRSD